jgi:hypothetical protein
MLDVEERSDDFVDESEIAATMPFNQSEQIKKRAIDRVAQLVQEMEHDDFIVE